MNEASKQESLACDLKKYSWKEITQHTGLTDRWIVINEIVYDVTEWQKKHPGGARILGHVAGQDATDAFAAVHKDKAMASKIMKNLVVGRVISSSDPCDNSNINLTQDYRLLRKVVEDSGFYRPNPLFYIAHLSQIIFLEVLSYLVLRYCGTSWPSFFLAASLLATSQAQAGWLQHDFGHLSVFSTSKLNHLAHCIMMQGLKGASGHWWNFRHNQHHVKPNKIRKDPDIAVPRLFLLGNKQPVSWGQRHRGGVLPYNWQHIYFWIIGPPALLPFYFLYENLYFVCKRRDFVGLACMVLFTWRFYYTYSPFVGALGTVILYFLFRLLESFWFIACTQMNHITMDVDKDYNCDWVTSQALTTCNVQPSFFNDWFTGHLNYQIEHHLFPLMPRHNYRKVQPLVKTLFKKHDLVYTEKSLLNAFLDIYRCLRKSGQLWYDAYQKASL